MPAHEAPCVELGCVPEDQNVLTSSPSEVSTASSPEPQNVRVTPTPLFRALAMLPPEPDQPLGQDELERRLPGYRRIVIPRELTLLEILKQSSGVETDEEVLQIREAKLRVIAEKIGLRRLHVLAPRLKSLTLDGSSLSSLRDLGIGLVHLKMLSVNRCGLSSLDGIWGLEKLRELHAAGNQIEDLQHLAVLQKLHTLDLADNPITESSRIWTLGVCASLKRLTLKGTPASDLSDYRERIASSLPQLVFLDDRPTNAEDDDFEGEIDIIDIKGSESDSSDAEGDEVNVNKLTTQNVSEPMPGPSTNAMSEEPGQDEDQDSITIELSPPPVRRTRSRPSTTECAGERPKYILPPRPHTAKARPVDTPTRLKILNTLMDDEWRCSGSKLTSHAAVCGNIARALRRPTTTLQRLSLGVPTGSENKELKSDETASPLIKGQKIAAEQQLLQETISDARRALAAEIPRAPRLEDWEKFRKETGIEIELDFNERLKGDPFRAIERLEQIERETTDRLNNSTEQTFVADAKLSLENITDDMWKGIQKMAPNDKPDGDTDLPTYDIINPVCASTFCSNDDDTS